jgi:hypothetical protein
VHKVKHHAALPYRDIGAFMVRLREETSIAARALALLILTREMISPKAPRAERPWR